MADFCAVCGTKLHEQDIFPKGYPKKWKFCCVCLWVAQYYYNKEAGMEQYQSELWLINRLEKYEVYLSLSLDGKNRTNLQEKI